MKVTRAIIDIELDTKIKADLGWMLTQGPMTELIKLRYIKLQKSSGLSDSTFEPAWSSVKSLVFRTLIQNITAYMNRQTTMMPRQIRPLKLAKSIDNAINLGVTMKKTIGPTNK